jgi:hypothetical protein
LKVCSVKDPTRAIFKSAEEEPESHAPMGHVWNRDDQPSPRSEEGTKLFEKAERVAHVLKHIEQHDKIELAAGEGSYVGIHLIVGRAERCLCAWIDLDSDELLRIRRTGRAPDPPSAGPDIEHPLTFYVGCELSKCPVVARAV